MISFPYIFNWYVFFCVLSVSCLIIYKKKCISITPKKYYLEDIKEKLSQYINNPSYVYKKCRDTTSKSNMRVWLVVMKKLKSSRTNEDRSNVSDSNHAKFRADKLEVIDIINVNNPNTTKDFIVNSHCGMKKSYKVGSTVSVKNYDINKNIVCAPGIHYFKTLDTAYLFDNVPKSFNGILTRWDENGQKIGKGRYNGCTGKTGIWTEWSKDGTKYCKGNYANNKKKGKWVSWYDNGNIKFVGKFDNDEQKGIWTYYYNNGEVKERINFQ